MENVIIYNLPPCPHCGGHGDVMQEYYDGFFGKESLWFARCRSCGLVTKNVGNPREAAKAWKTLCKEYKK